MAAPSIGYSTTDMDKQRKYSIHLSFYAKESSNSLLIFALALITGEWSGHSRCGARKTSIGSILTQG